MRRTVRGLRRMNAYRGRLEHFGQPVRGKTDTCARSGAWVGHFDSAKRALLRIYLNIFRLFLVGMAVRMAFLLLLGPALEVIGLPSDAHTLKKALTNPTIERLETENGLHIRCACPMRIRASDIPDHMREALIAREDRRFRMHQGVDYVGIGRALVADLLRGDTRQGGSTLTQQLAKTIVGDDKSVRRKIREALLAKRIERVFDKDDILNLYLNRVYFGGNAYGIEQAARIYFGKHAHDLTLLESATLVGMLKAPNRLSPADHPVKARSAAATVLRAMVGQGMITPARARKALASSVRQGDVPPVRLAIGRFQAWVEKRVTDLAPLPDDGQWQAVVSLDTWQQLAAQWAVKRNLEKVAWHDIDDVALVSMRPDSLVRAMIGGRKRFVHSQFNAATQAKRQPGSTFKIVPYLAAIEEGYTPDSRILDDPVSIDGWRPANYDGRFLGAMTMSEAFARSRNAATVRLARKIGFKRVAETARRLDLPGATNPASVLGTSEVRPIDLVGAYATIAAQGHRAEPGAVIAVLDSNGSVLYRRQRGGDRVVAAADAEAMDRMLKIAAQKGTGYRAAFDTTVAGKTGTTQHDRDA